MRNSFLLLWAKYFSATLCPSLSRCAYCSVLHGFLMLHSWCPCPGAHRPQPQSLGVCVPLWCDMTPQLLVPLMRTTEQDHELLQLNGCLVPGGFSHCCFRWSQFYREEHLAKWMKTPMPPSLRVRARADADF